MSVAAYSSISNKFRNAFENMRDARLLSIASWITAHIRGHRAVSITLSDPSQNLVPSQLPTETDLIFCKGRPRSHVMAGCFCDADTLTCATSPGLALAGMVVGRVSFQTGHYNKAVRYLRVDMKFGTNSDGQRVQHFGGVPFSASPQLLSLGPSFSE